MAILQFQNHKKNLVKIQKGKMVLKGDLRSFVSTINLWFEINAILKKCFEKIYGDDKF